MTGDEEFFQARGFGHRIGFGARPALIIVDFIKAFTNPDAPLGCDLSAEIDAVNTLIAAARGAGAPIIAATAEYHGAEAKDAGIWTLKQKGIFSLLAGTEGPEFDPRLDLRDSDSILHKKYASCFFGTDLSSRLVAMRIDTLLITGCTTSGCVRATAVDSLQSGFRPMVVAEAVGDRSASAHQQSLFDLDQKYADVVSLAETVAYLNGLEASNE